MYCLYQCRSINKGKGCLESSPHDEDEEEIDDWNEEEIKLALSKSWYVISLYLLLILLITPTVCLNYSDDVNTFVEGLSKNAVADTDDSDPFLDVVTKNVMPVPPLKDKKVYLEDYENFSVKQVFLFDLISEFIY